MKTAKPLPSQEELQTLLRYDPTTGQLFWKHREAATFRDGRVLSAEGICRRWNARFAGKPAITAVEARRGNSVGYYVGIVWRVRYKAHRLIWKLVHGADPDYIDHIDGNPMNNRIENLRSVKPISNSRNQKLRVTNTSGVNGVYWSKGKSKWVAQVRIGPNRLRIGRYRSFDAACEARQKYDEANGYHPNHGKRRA